MIISNGIEMEKADRLADEAERNMRERRKYFQEHPEIKQLMTDFMTSLLIHKPEEPLEFARNFFHLHPYRPRFRFFGSPTNPTD